MAGSHHPGASVKRVQIPMARWSLGIVLAILSGPAGAQPPAQVAEARNLGADGRTSRDLAAPIVLVVTREGCGYCARLMSAVIVPMILSREYEDRALIRELCIDSGTDVVDFDGRTVSPFAVANGYQALLTPTVLILGPDGTEVAPRLVGINNEQMYLWYLDRAIEEGTAEMAGAGGRAQPPRSAPR